MNAYRAYDVIEERKWAEQTLTEEKQKWIDDRAQEIIDALPKEPSGLFRFSVRWTPAHTKDFAAISWRGLQRFHFGSCLRPGGIRLGTPYRLPVLRMHEMSETKTHYRKAFDSLT
jgi:hypothetical protein